MVLVGLGLQLWVTATTTGGFYPSNPQRVLNVFAFFTVQSNVLVCLTSLWLAVRPDTTGTLLRTLRLDALLGISVTGVVFHLALRQLQDLRGEAAVADFLLHTASPVLCVLGWLLLGPRGAVDGRVIAWALLFPVAWSAGTLLRGSALGFWPYPFLNADDLGWARALTNCALVAVLFTGLALVAARADRVLPGRRATASPSCTDERSGG